jgi:uncharacterized repeat protein (TIGR02543 family)
MGTVAGAGIYPTGTNATATATAKASYVFLNWTENGIPVSVSPTYSFTVLSARNLRANFAAGFTIGTTSSFGPGGTVSGAGNYATGSQVTMVATPADGYRFTGWTEGGALVSSSSSYAFTATANRTLVAHFVPIVGITRSPAGVLSIAWPASAAGWILQESPDLSPPSWVNSTLPITTNGTHNQVSVINPTGQLFFRLAQP